MQNPQANAEYSPIIVPIQKGRGTPVFLVHSALGSTGYYAHLARELGIDAPLYGINAVGLFGDAPALDSFRDMASHYVRAVRTVLPSGPYTLVGHSMGAYVAFEMCLQSPAEQVPRCVVIDQAAPDYAGFGTQISNGEIGSSVTALISVIAWLHMRPLPAPRKQIRATLASLDEEGQLAQIARWLKDLRFLPQSASDDQAAAFLGVVMANCNAEAQWSTAGRNYDGQLIVVRAEKSHRKPDAYEQWQKYCSKPVQHFTTPGTHATVMTLPHVSQLAQRLQGVLGVEIA